MTSTDPLAPVTSTKARAAPGEARRVSAGYVMSYGGGRICSRSGCTTVLSIYNGGSSCSAHPIGDAAGNPTPNNR